jgi:hypothetical protein
LFLGVRPDGSILIRREDDEPLHLGNEIQLPEGFALEALRALQGSGVGQAGGASMTTGQAEPAAGGGRADGPARGAAAALAPPVAPGGAPQTPSPVSSEETQCPSPAPCDETAADASPPALPDAAADSLGKAHLEAATLLAALRALMSSSAAGCASTIAALRSRIKLLSSHVEEAAFEAEREEERRTAAQAISTPAPADGAQVLATASKRARPSPPTQPPAMALMAPSPPSGLVRPIARRPAAVDAVPAGVTAAQRPQAGASSVGGSASEPIQIDITF